MDTLALSPDPLPKLITCSRNDRHIPSMHQQQAIYVLDWLLHPSDGRRSWVYRHVGCTEVWRWIHQQSPISGIEPVSLLCVEMEKKGSSPFLDTISPSPPPPPTKKKIKTKICDVREMHEKSDFSSYVMAAFSHLHHRFSFNPSMPVESVALICMSCFFLSLNSMMEGLTATNRAMLPSLGQKVKYTFYTTALSARSLFEKRF